MQNRMSRTRPQAGAGTRQGDTIPAQGETQGKAPRMPHERDESADSQAAREPSGQQMGRQAAQDVERGMVDTSKGEALARTYDKVREGADERVRKNPS